MEHTMNKLLAIITFLISSTVSSAALAMQEPTKTETITYSEPFKTTNNFKICAFANGTKIGSVKYREEDNKDWYFEKLTVNKEHRKTENKVGFNLFSKMIEQIRKHNPNRIHWYAVNNEKYEGPALAIVVNIYHRMIAELELTNISSIEQFRTSAFMALNFNKGVIQ